MKNFRNTISVIYIIICSITVLVMLTTSFNLFNEKYLPSFMLAQKFALPIILSAMAITYLTFFEPERLLNKIIMLFTKIGFALTLGLFAFYIFTLNSVTASGMTLTVYWIQLVATALITLSLFLKQD